MPIATLFSKSCVGPELSRNKKRGGSCTFAYQHQNYKCRAANCIPKVVSAQNCHIQIYVSEPSGNRFIVKSGIRNMKKRMKEFISGRAHKDIIKNILTML